MEAENDKKANGFSETRISREKGELVGVGTGKDCEKH